jgi:thiol-disulfide isomerase/thioredoxin
MRIILLAFTLILSNFLISQNQSVKLSGCIENPNHSDVKIYGPNRYMKVISLSNGCFSDTLMVDKGSYTFSDGNESSAIYLLPGYDLNITLNTEEFDESIKYEGVGAGNNNYLAKIYLYNEQNNLNTVFSKKGSMNPDKFLRHQLSFDKGALEILEEMNLSDIEFVNTQKEILKYSSLNLILNQLNTDVLTEKGEKYKLSKYLLAEFKKLNVSDTLLFATNRSYKSVVNSFFRCGLVANNSIFVNEYNKLSSELIKKNITNNMARYLSFRTENIDSYFNAINLISTDSIFIDTYTKTYNKIKSLSKGNPSPSFKYKNYKGSTTSLADLKGKLIYIDIWATWCGPCKAQIPYLAKLEEKFHNQNIVFVSISIDKPKDEGKWIAMIENKKMGGVQLMADNAWKSSIVKDYVIKGIPRFILLDEKGNIIEANSSRPMVYNSKGEEVVNDDLINKINELLKVN